MEASARTQPQSILRWVHPPQQARTRAALDRLLDAAEHLLAEHGFDEMSIADLARRARTSVGGFYRRFRDKEGLLQALHERFCAAARATADDAFERSKWAQASLGEILEQITAFLADIYREREGLFRAFLEQGAKHDNVRERTNGLFRHIAGRLADLLAERRDELTHPAPQLAANFGLRAVLGTLNHTIQLQPGSLTLDDPALDRELAWLLIRYLGVKEPAEHE